MGDSEKALEYVRGVETQLGDAFDYIKVPLLVEVGRPDEAAQVVQTNGDAGHLQAVHALALARAGREAEARQIIASLAAQNYESPVLVGALLAVGDREAAESLVRSTDARPGGAQFLTDLITYVYGGKLFFDLAWAPNLAERLEEAGIEFERWAGLP